MAGRGAAGDHTTPWRWRQRYAPELEKRALWRQNRLCQSWRVDETHVTVKGKWRCLFRAVAKACRTLDLHRSDTRNARAAKRFLAQALKRSGHDRPCKVNADKNPACGEATRGLKKGGRLGADCQHRQATCLNNVVAAGHGKLKRLIRPTLGFQALRTACAALKGFEIMRLFGKGQLDVWIECMGGGTEASLISRLFGVHAAPAA